MALTVDCVCEGSENVKLCEVDSLKFVITNSTCELSTSTFALRGGPSSFELDCSTAVVGEWNLTPVADWLAAWDDLYIHWEMERSLSSDDLVRALIEFHIEVKFKCTDAHDNVSYQVELTRNSEVQEQFCYGDDGSFRAFGHLGNGVADGAIIHTRPLAACNGFTVEGGLFRPSPLDLQVIDVVNSSDVCACASGGSGISFVITDGELPSGWTLNPLTGCLEGISDGFLGSTREITITAYDSAGNESSVTCVYFFCGSIAISVNEFY